MSQATMGDPHTERDTVTMSNSNNASSVSNLINTKLTDETPGKAADTRKKFIIFLDAETKAKLDAVAAATKSGKIELATEISKLGIDDAFTMCVNAGKIDPRTGSVLGTKAVKVKGKKKADEGVVSDDTPAGEVPEVPADLAGVA